MSRSYGRIEGGKWLVFSQPYERGNKFSIIGAVSNKAVIAAMYTGGSIDGSCFLHYVEKYLAPNLKPCYCVVMDNVGFHKVANSWGRRYY
ncbi:hypothetical protein BH10PSE19_BH10PSE19_07290 [soil metagenome]